MKMMVCRGRTALLIFAAAAAVFVTGVGFTKHKLMPAMAQEKLHPIYSVERPEGEKKVSLGINCAWDNSDIPQMLEILASADVKATFFIQGEWAEKYPESVKAISDAGHEIGSHSYSHDDMAKMNPEEIRSQAQQSSDAISGRTGKKVTLFRVPSGSYNNTVIQVLTEEGYLPIQWDIDSRDWKKPSLEKLVANCTKKTEPGSILLLHSGGEKTAEALPQIIANLKEQGFEIVPVGELIYTQDYVIDRTGRQRAVQ